MRRDRVNEPTRMPSPATIRFRKVLLFLGLGWLVPECSCGCGCLEEEAGDDTA
jgi:hypothetical protein